MIGERGEGIKKLSHLLVRMITNIEDKLGCFFMYSQNSLQNWTLTQL